MTTEATLDQKLRTVDAGEHVIHMAEDSFGKSSARFSRDGQYRYSLMRHWADGPVMAFVMLNPSTADALKLDPTVTNCVRFAKREGCGTLYVANLFPLRATDPKVMKQHPDPLGPKVAADIAITTIADIADTVVVAWGAHGKFMGRGEEVHRMLWRICKPFRLGEPNKDGSPRHPLYMAADTPLVPHNWR